MKDYLKQNQSTITGYFLILVSLIIFYVGGEISFKKTGGIEPIFIFNYLIAIIFLIFTFVDRNIYSATGKKVFDLKNTSITLVLFNISAYSLNRDVVVFRESTTWLVIFLIIFNLAFLVYSLQLKLPQWLKYFVVSILVCGLFFHVYQAIFVMHIAALGLLVFWFFGISLHALVPISYVILTSKQLVKFLNHDKKASYFAIGSAITTVAIIVCFSIVYNNIYQSISRTENLANSYNQTEELPRWVSIAQKLSSNSITEKVLKADLIYQTNNHEFWSMDLNTFNDKRVNDPLVSFADLFVNHSKSLNQQDKIKIIKSLYGNRHLNEERLWSGRNLRTKSVISNIEFFPSERLAYTEYFVTVRNISSRDRDQNEAIYTFDLPEGSAVSSLSLWINGVEEKAILTTKGLAKKAYQEIVGVERRDPSLVQWKEGNKISVRVFPCTPTEDRQFKIGITSPLKIQNQKLVYESIKVDGERIIEADQYLNIINEGLDVEGHNISINEEEEYDYEGTFNQDFTLSIDARSRIWGEFIWKGYKYSMVPTTYETKDFEIKDVYLDLNESWEFSELETIITENPSLNFWTANKKSINSNNLNKTWKTAKKQRFSLFPFHQITEKKAIVISKESNETPNLYELYESEFGANLKNLISEKNSEIYVLSLSQNKKDYLKSLAELSVFHSLETNIDDVSKILQQRKIEIPKEHENLVYIEESKLSIQKTKIDSSKASSGNDHIYRLFAYRDILRKIGTSYFDENYINQELIDLASDANIVSPLSSLIVLETQNDYDRFGIKKDENSLGNASLSNSGAVPEPHEWALIILFVGFIAYTYYQKRRKSLAHA